MAVYPSGLTVEEKSLRKRYARLQEKQLRQRAEKPALPSSSSSSSSSSPSKQSQKEVLTPKEAKAAARKLLEAGKLTIKSRAPVKRSGFKRVGELPSLTPAAKRANTGQSLPVQAQDPPKPKVKASDVQKLYSRFVKASKPDDLERIPRRGSGEEAPAQPQFSITKCTVCVKCRELGEEALKTAFSRFGDIQSVTMDHSRSSFFITFASPSIANTAKKEMNNGMVRGCDVYVDLASAENGFFELSAAAASHPWAQLAAGRNLEDTAARKGEGVKGRLKVVTYEADF